jgi:hypothetical protein
LLLFLLTKTQAQRVLAGKWLDKERKAAFFSTPPTPSLQIKFLANQNTLPTSRLYFLIPSLPNCHAKAEHPVSILHFFFLFFNFYSLYKCLHGAKVCKASHHSAGSPFSRQGVSSHDHFSFIACLYPQAMLRNLDFGPEHYVSQFSSGQLSSCTLQFSYHSVHFSFPRPFKLSYTACHFTAAGTPCNFERLSTPAMTPSALGGSPLMTWGDIASTPLRLDPEDTAVAFDPQALQGPSFSIPGTPKRELVRH